MGDRDPVAKNIEMCASLLTWLSDMVSKIDQVLGLELALVLITAA
jgi:hypothetical protein